MNIHQILEHLWVQYHTENPEAKQIHDLFVNQGETVLNDHIAFRTFNHPKINIEKLSTVFTSNGYQAKGEYHFEDKHLFARHFEHETDESLPRIFISELKLEEMSSDLQSTVNQYLNKIKVDDLNQLDLISSGNIWGLPDFKTYDRIRQESEYAAWLLVYGFTPNHFTVNINALKKWDSIEKVNQFLKENGFLLNNAGGEIKGTPQELLEQSSTKAGLRKIDFPDGTFEIPGCYYEFARRYPDANGQIYSGFIAKSADKIFESTNFYKKDSSDE